MLCSFATIDPGFAQRLFHRINTSGEAAAKELSKLDKKIFYDSALLAAAMDKVLTNLQAKGYLLATFDSLQWNGDTLMGSLSSGTKHHLVISGLTTRKQYLQTSSADAAYYEAVEKELSRYLNSGYPFAKVYFDSARLINDTLVAHAKVQKGPHIVFDTLALSGATKTRRSFLQKLLMISPGTPYSEKLVASIPARLNASMYLETTSVPTVDFYAGKARVNLNIAEPAVNQLDGLIGLLPDQNNSTGKLLLTGQVRADLYHLFGTGKHLFLHWQNFNVSSQQLNLAYDHPVLFGSPLNLFTSFHQLKQDTTFVIRRASVGFSFPLTASFDLSFGASFKRNTLLSENTLSDTEPLLNADSRINEYSVGFTYASLNSIFLPSEGRRIRFNASVGQKEIIRNGAISSALYENIALNTLQSSVSFSFDNYLKVLKNSVFVQQVGLAGLVNKELFQNDFYRVGGLTDTGYALRGFNENQFFASSFVLMALEWRFLIDQQSYLVSFVDQGLMATASGGVYAVGFGTGLLLKVNAGFFRLAVAVGSADGQSLDFTQPKVHFGFVNRF